MKQLLTCCLSILIIGAVNAQKEPKGSPTKAESYLSKGDLSNAKVEIDKAMTIEKIAAKADTWLTKAKVYQAIALEGDDGAIAITMEAYNKYKEMDPKGGIFVDLQNIAGFQGEYFNKGSESYNDEDYDASLANFHRALQVSPNDSLTIYYSALAAYQADKKDITLKHYKKLMALNYADAETYGNAIYIAKDILEDNDEALVIVQEAQKKFPENSQFKYDEINIYLKQGNQEVALEKLESAGQEDPENPSVQLQLALFKDNMAYNAMTEGDKETSKELFEQAIAHYSKVLEVKDGDDFIANYNLGVIYVNLAKGRYDAVRAMDMTTYNKDGKRITEEGNKIIANALPLIEKATEITPGDVEAWRALMQIYTQLKMNDKAEAALNKVDELTGAAAK
ncbi:MAG: hypothetical protein O2887_13920 [Bacteroidetes bacterium]|nr:hypothetical protein [Bacteroidota bacterium]MDA1121566.1 hypothetical protein [Bacteroidota bacterium]